MVTGIDSNLLLSLYGARSGATGTRPNTPTKKVAPSAPWTRTVTPAETSAAVKAALQGQRLVNESSAQLDLPGASADYRKLFALYQGLSVLGDLASEVQKRGLTSVERMRFQQAFGRGMAEVGEYVKTAKLETVRLTQGEAASSVKTNAPVAATKTEYVTRPLSSGSSADSVVRFQGDVRFSMAVTRSGVTYDININLADMGATTRSMANVVNHVNDKLAAAGVDTRLATVRIPGQDKTTTVGGKTVSLGKQPDQWALKVKTNGESVSFSAPANAGSVYLAQSVGNPNPDGKADTADGVVRQQILKFQTDTVGVEAPVQGADEANWVDGRTFARTLGAEVKTVRATQTGPDGSVYVLADVTDKTAGQAIRGAQDVALLKYDTAGNLVFSRTLGASASATGLALAVNVDGKVAIAGSVSGGLSGAVEGAVNSGVAGAFAGQADSFVTVFNADGEELWTQRRGARLADEASQIAFGPDGSVYVAGRAKSALPGASALGDWDGYIQGFGPPNSQGQVSSRFSEMFGTAGADRPAGMVMDGGSLVTASVENGRAVLRRYDVSGAAPVLTSTRDLGDLQGGDITGLALDGGELVLAGSTANAGLTGGAVTRAHAGGVDAFAARMAADLSAGGRIAFYGGTGDDRASGLAVTGGQVWIAGSAGADLPGQPSVGTKDGFLTRLDVNAGAVAWSRRFTGKEGYATPGAISVDPTGSTSLDRLGLPLGALDFRDSQKLVSASGLRPGDQFGVRAGSGRTTNVTIELNETLETLAQKIRRASGFNAKVTITSSEGVRKLSISPQIQRSVIEFSAGSAGRDALELLGVPAGVVRGTVVTDNGTRPADGTPQIYGLGLPAGLNLSTDGEIKHAAAEVAAAMGVIRKAYKDLVTAATPRSQQAAAQAAASGPVPKYMTDQIANYQAALARLGG
jgi:hypothetical protein